MGHPVDTATNSISLVSNLRPLHVFLNNCQKDNQTLDIHSTGNHAPSDFVLLLKEASDFCQEAVSKIESRIQISKNVLNESFGFISHGSRLKAFKTQDKHKTGFVNFIQKFKL